MNMQQSFFVYFRISGTQNAYSSDSYLAKELDGITGIAVNYKQDGFGRLIHKERNGINDLRRKQLFKVGKFSRTKNRYAYRFDSARAYKLQEE